MSLLVIGLATLSMGLGENSDYNDGEIKVKNLFQVAFIEQSSATYSI